MLCVLRSLLLTLRGYVRARAALQLELLALRHQLQVPERTRPRRVSLTRWDRLLWVRLSQRWTAWRGALVIVKPETVIAWRREASASSGPQAVERVIAIVDQVRGIRALPAPETR
jgi:putative transposase